VGVGQPVIPNSPNVCDWPEPDITTPKSKRVALTISTVDPFTGKRPVQGISKTPAGGVGKDAHNATTPAFGTGLNVKKGSSSFQVSEYGFSED
jgi:hypothetical protein